jgi:hypothetical protein
MLKTKLGKTAILLLFLAFLVSNVNLSNAATVSPLTAALSESASALNYGVKINFTVVAEGGVSPYVYTWYVDNQTDQTGASPYYSTNSLAVGSHKVYVDVMDANITLATTNAVSFEVLPALSSSPGSTPTLTPLHSSPIPNYTLIMILAFVVLVVFLVGSWLVWKYRKQKTANCAPNF